MMQNDALLDVRDLKTHFFLDEGVVKAVDGASFTLRRGRTLAIVGESGCGKSVMARSIMGIVAKPGRIVDGQILLHVDGQQLNLAQEKLDTPALRSLRGKKMGMIFQEPMAFLSPVHSIGSQIMESLHWHTDLNKKEQRHRAIEMLKKVGLPKPEKRMDMYPHQLSGGQRQRAMIAMALINQPELLIADEPTTALDVTTQAQILELLQQLAAELNMTTIIITHDLGVVAEVADEVAVMYLGNVVEFAPVDELFYAPKHPYTIGLLQSIPRLDAEVREKLNAISGSVPHPYNRPTGCSFHPRCRARVQHNLGICRTTMPELLPVNERQQVRCWLHHDDPASGHKAAVTDAALAAV
jgi:oligopeptide/dipeptide ABC transporter ATP-binding protein